MPDKEEEREGGEKVWVQALALLQTPLPKLGHRHAGGGEEVGWGLPCVHWAFSQV